MCNNETFFMYGIFQEVEINKRRPTFIKAKERVAHIQKKLDSAKKSLAQALKANAAHSEDIQELEKELEEVDKRRQEYEDEIAGESSSQGRDVHLEDAQVNEGFLAAGDRNKKIRIKKC